VSGRNCRPARRLNVGTITTSEQSALGTRALPGRKVNRIGRVGTERRARTTPIEASRAAHIGIDVWCVLW
jgi:hypothetical protein